MFDKEIKVHSALKHKNVLDFISVLIVEPDKPNGWFPGIYMLLEIAAGGDLFDKIGVCFGTELGTEADVVRALQFLMLVLEKRLLNITSHNWLVVWCVPL